MPFEYTCTLYIFCKHIYAKFARERPILVFFRVLSVNRLRPLVYTVRYVVVHRNSGETHTDTVYVRDFRSINKRFIRGTKQTGTLRNNTIISKNY